MSFLIYKPFKSAVFWGLFVLFTAILIVARFLLRNKSERFRALALSIAMWITLVLFFVYKFLLSIDTEYSEICAAAGTGPFNWWQELPLQLCNINMILIPIAALSKKRPLLSFCFFMGPLGALMAIIMPSVGFSDCSILLPRMLGFYFTHFMILFGSLAIVVFGLFKPKYKDIFITTISALATAFVACCISLIIRKTGLCSTANYFYSVETDGNFLLDLFDSWVPPFDKTIPFIYLIPSIIILWPYILIVTSVVKLSEIIEKKKKGDTVAS